MMTKIIQMTFDMVTTSSARELTTGRVFYTTDTDAWLHFTLAGLEFDTAEVELTLKHMESGSIFRHQKSIQFPYFFYKLKDGKEDPNNEIRRAGSWAGQIVAKTPDGRNTARQFSFRIVDHLLKDEEVPETINHEVLTAEEYNAIEEKDSKTLYIVVSEEEEET